jgi:hypothetical protein
MSLSSSCPKPPLTAACWNFIKVVHSLLSRPIRLSLFSSGRLFHVAVAVSRGCERLEAEAATEMSSR